MKSWSEVKEGMTVYIVDPQPVFEEDNYSETPNGHTEPYTKAQVGYTDRDEHQIIVKAGKYKGIEMFFHASQDDIKCLVSDEEYRLLNMTEAIVWPKLAKLLPEIEALKEKSDDMLTIEKLVKKNKA